VQDIEEDSTEAESNSRAVESMKLLQEPFLTTENDGYFFFPCFTRFLGYLTALDCGSPKPLQRHLSLVACTLLSYHLQRECSRPV